MPNAKPNERIDLILAYGVEGNADLEQLDRNLTQLEERGTNVNKLTLRSREIMAEKRKADQEASKATEQLTQKQFDLATAVSESNDIVRQVAIGAELLKLEFEEGAITQDQYNKGLGDLRNQLDGMEVITMGGARAMRSLSGEQRRLNQTSNTSIRSLGRQQRVLAGTTDIMFAMQGGVGNLSSSLPLLIQRMQRMGHASGETGGAFKMITGFLASPAGLVAMSAALIPLIISMNEKFGFLNTTLYDTEEVAKGVAKGLAEIRKELVKALELEGIDAMKKELELAKEQLAEFEDDPARRSWLERSFHRANAILNAMPGARVLSQGLLADAQSREETIEEINEQIRELEQSIRSANRIQESDVARRQRQMTEFLKIYKEVNDELDEILKDSAIDTSEEFIESEGGDRLAEQEQERTERLKAQAKERFEFEKHIDQMRLDNLLSVSSERQRLEIEEQEAIQAIAENEVLTARQKEEAIYEIEKQFAIRRAQLTKDEEEEKRLARQQTFDLAVDLLASLDGFGEVIFGQSEKRAKQAFKLNKAIALVNATVQGAQAVVRAFAEGGPVDAALVAGAVAAQIAKIASTQFKGSASGGSTRTDTGRFQHGFRGISADPTLVGSGGAMNLKIPDTLKLTDSAGKLLTELEYARDSDGDSAYLVPKD